MIEFAKITGEVDNNLMQVKMRTGECLFAPIAIVGTDVSIPSEKWVKENASSFLALVTYEKDMYISPMIIGFYPVKGADSSTYNTHELLISIFEELLQVLKDARTNTQVGPQKFMPDTQVKLDTISDKISSIKGLINSIKL